MKKCGTAIVALFILLAGLGCEESDNTATLKIRAQIVDQGVAFPQPGIDMGGDWRLDIEGVRHGLQSSFVGISDQGGRIDIADGRVPAIWLISEANGLCGGQSALIAFYYQVVNDVICLVIRLQSQASPSPLNTYSTPTTITINGDGMSQQYGMPHLVLYNESGTSVAEFSAYWVSGDGQTLDATTPSLVGLAAGTYVVMVMNAQADGTFVPAFGTTFGVNP